jgi:hypothetical protein
MRIRIVAAMAALSIAFLGCGPLSSAELKRQATTVSAIAAEGALLADQVAEDRTKDTFVRVHADELAGEMDHTDAKLSETEEEGEVPDELSGQVKQVIQLAGDTADALQELELSPQDPGRAAESSDKLEQLSDQATELSEEL